MRLSDTTRISSATPGKKLIQYSPESRNSKPLAMSNPREGSVTGTPTPRKLSVASSAMAEAIWIVATTSTGPRQFGRMWTKMTRRLGKPRFRAASTYSLRRSTRAEARMMRAYWAHCTATMANTTLSTPRPTEASSTSATRMVGKPRMKSTRRISTVSRKPPA